MVLENVKEMWTEKPKGSGGKGKGVNKDRFISKMYGVLFCLFFPCPSLAACDVGRRGSGDLELEMFCSCSLFCVVWLSRAELIVFDPI